jgi:hypothetical protein
MNRNPARDSLAMILTFMLVIAAMSGFGGVAALWRGSGTGTIGDAPDQMTAAESPSNVPDRTEGLSGRVLNGRTGKPIATATVHHNGVTVRTGSDGSFLLEKTDPRKPVLIKASGYRQTSVTSTAGHLEAALTPIEVRGLYLTHYGVGSRLLRSQVLGLIGSTDLNAVVIDVKGDRGFLSSRYEVPLASLIGATKKTTVGDMRSLIERLHQQNIYVIGRIVVFKDDILAHAKPELAICDTRTGEPWTDREHLAWVDPFRKEVWDYNIAIATEAARTGFDEIQFDYVRFPTDGRLSVARYSQPNTMENRVKTINQLLEKTQQALLPYNVYLSADLFGYTPWNYNDTDIGQKIEDVANYVDYICLMVYPSGYHLGIPGYLQPVAHPYEVVYYTLEKAKKRLGGREKMLRPWLQNFRDYAFDRRLYAGNEIRLQIEACQKAATGGYLLWDPSNMYRHTADAMVALKTGPRPLDGQAGRTNTMVQ